MTKTVIKILKVSQILFPTSVTNINVNFEFLVDDLIILSPTSFTAGTSDWHHHLENVTNKKL